MTVSSPDDLLEQKRKSASLYWKALPLRPGRYKIDIVIKDVNNTDKVGYWSRGMEVPKYDDDRLSASSLILANRMERVPSKQIGAGNFVSATPSCGRMFHPMRSRRPASTVPRT